MDRKKTLLKSYVIPMRNNFTAIFIVIDERIEIKFTNKHTHSERAHSMKNELLLFSSVSLALWFSLSFYVLYSIYFYYTAFAVCFLLFYVLHYDT